MALGNLRSAARGHDGSTAYVFGGEFSLSSVPASLDVHRSRTSGTISVAPGLRATGRSTATSVSMDES